MRRPKLKTPTSAKPVRVFVVDDQEDWVEHLQTLVQLNPDCGVEIAGSAKSNSNELPAEIERAKANVALIDVLLRHNLSPEELEIFDQFNGIKASRAIRDRMGDDVKIVVWSGFDFKQRAITEGKADYFLAKGYPKGLDLLRFLRSIGPGGRKRKPGTPPVQTFSDVDQIQLFVAERRVVMTNSSGQAAQIPIRQEKQLALLWYLLEARKNGERWVKRGGLDPKMGGRVYDMVNEDVWGEICKSIGTNLPLQQRSSDVASVVFAINRAFSRVLGKAPLVLRPGPGRIGPHRFYQLRLEIRAERIAIHER